MATHSGILAYKIPWTEEPGGLQSLGSQKSLTWLREWVHTHTLPTRFALSSGILGHFPHTQNLSDFITQIRVLSETFSWASWCSGLKNWDFLLLASNSCLGYKSHFFLVLGVSCFDLRSILNQISLDRGEHSESIWFYMIQLASTQVNSIQLSYSEHLLWDQPHMGHHSAWQTNGKNAYGENVTYSYNLPASSLLSTLTSNKLHLSIFYFFSPRTSYQAFKSSCHIKGKALVWDITRDLTTALEAEL